VGAAVESLAAALPEGELVAVLADARDEATRLAGYEDEFIAERAGSRTRRCQTRKQRMHMATVRSSLRSISAKRFAQPLRVGTSRSQLEIAESEGGLNRSYDTLEAVLRT
jgi:hypothetical protein